MDKKKLFAYIKENFKEKPSLFYLDSDGYPIGFRIDAEINEDSIKLKGLEKIPSKRATIFFNHITALPSGGYTDRRYVYLKGEIKEKENKIFFEVDEHSFWDEKIIPFPMYCEANVKQAKLYLEKLSKKYGKPVKPYIGKFWLIFKTIRLPFLIASIIPALIGIAIAVKNGFFDPILAMLVIIGVAAIHAALNVANDYHDYRTGADEVNLTPTPFSGGSRIIQHGLLSPDSVFKVFSSLYALGLAIGTFLALTRGLIIALIMVIGVFISYFYSAKPLRFSEKGIGEVMVGIGFGPIIILGSYAVMAMSLSLDPLLVSIPIGILIALILYVNEIPDRQWDIKAGKLTLVARIKEEDIAKGYLIGIILTYATYALGLAYGSLPIYSLAVLALIPIAKKVYDGIKRGYHDPYSMIPYCAKHINLYTYFSIIILISIILDYFLASGVARI